MEKVNISPEVREARRAKMHQRAEESSKALETTVTENAIKEALSYATDFEILSVKDFAEKVQE